VFYALFVIVSILNHILNYVCLILTNFYL